MTVLALEKQNILPRARMTSKEFQDIAVCHIAGLAAVVMNYAVVDVVVKPRNLKIPFDSFAYFDYCGNQGERGRS